MAHRMHFACFCLWNVSENVQGQIPAASLDSIREFFHDSASKHICFFQTLTIVTDLSHLYFKHHMIGKLTSVEEGPERNVRLVVTPAAVFSEISEPVGAYEPQAIRALCR